MSHSWLFDVLNRFTFYKYYLKTDTKEFTRKLKLIDYFYECDHKGESGQKQNQKNNNEDLTHIFSKLGEFILHHL